MTDAVYSRSRLPLALPGEHARHGVARGPLPRAAFALLAALSLAACNTPSPEPGAPPAGEAAPVVVTEVVWPALSADGRAAFQALPALAQERVAASQVPVLLPPRKAWLASAGVATKPTWTTASMRAEGLTIVITASRAARVVPGVKPHEGNVKVRGEHRGFVTQNEGIWAASWVENHIAYSVEVECDQGGDARCADGSFALGVAGDLVFVGGGESLPKGGTR